MRNEEKVLWAEIELLRGSLNPLDAFLVVTTLYGFKVLADNVEVYESLRVTFNPEATWYGVLASPSPVSFLTKCLAVLAEEHPFRHLQGSHIPELFKTLGDERLSRLYLTFERSSLRINEASQLLNVGEVYTSLLTRLSAGDKGVRFDYTPPELNALKAGLLLTEFSDTPQSVYDPVCGVGGNFVEMFKQVPEKDRQDVHFYGQDLDETSLYICTWHLVLYGIVNFTLALGDTLMDPRLTEGGRGKELLKSDLVLADPPLSSKFRYDFGGTDSYQRFRYGEVRGSRADYAFLQHILSSLKAGGKAAVLVAPGVLFRSGFEQKIRANFIHADVVSASISLPGNLLHYVGIPMSLLLFNLDKEGTDRGNVLFIDATERGATSATRGRVATLGAETLDQLIQMVRERRVDAGVSAVVGTSELRDHEYSLVPEVYIPKPLPDLPSLDEIGHEITVLEGRILAERERFDQSLEAFMESFGKDK